MKLIELVIAEFITITEYLQEENNVENNKIVIDREDFKKLLEKYGYLTFKEKCKIYKQLNFIIHDKNNYTMPVRSNNKIERKVVINFSTYLTLKKLFNTIVEN